MINSLYNILLAENQTFKRKEMELRYADGEPRREEVLLTEVEVIVQKRTFVVEFIVIPSCERNSTLFGLDFIRSAGIAVNIDEGAIQYGFYSEDKPSCLMAPVSVDPVQGEAKQEATAELLRPEEGMTLTDIERNRLCKLLQEFNEVFQKNTAPTKYAEHRIETGGARPISLPPYRLSLDKRQFLEEQIEQMLENDIIEACESPWAAPVVIVPKDGTRRLCVDYRRLNEVTVSDSYPLPRIEDLLHLAKQTPYMSTLDLQMGYWQVPVAEADRDKTVFVCPFGTYRFKRMAFGLKL